MGHVVPATGILPDLASVHTAKSQIPPGTIPKMATDTRPVVLRIGEDIKYNHDFYNDVFTKRFKVVANEEPDRASFIAALKAKR